MGPDDPCVAWAALGVGEADDDARTDILHALGIEATFDSTTTSDLCVEYSDYVASHMGDTVDLLEAIGIDHDEARDVVRRATSDGPPPPVPAPRPPASAAPPPRHPPAPLPGHYRPGLRTIPSVGDLPAAATAAAAAPTEKCVKADKRRAPSWFARLTRRR